MLKSNRDSNHSLRDHVNHHSKFCSDINWTNNSTLNVLICLFLQHCITHQVLQRPSFNSECELSV